MKRIILACICIMLSAINITAQKKKKATTAPTPSAEEYIKKFWFEKAEEVLEKEITTLKKKRKSTARQDSLLDVIDRLRVITHATERVVVIDSIIVDEKDVLNHLTLSEESGMIIPSSTFFDNTADTTGAMVFKPQIGSKIYFAKADENGLLKLHSSDYIDRNWQEHQIISELEDSIQNYPFALADGLTLYYAAKGDECIGGYDIFVTRYDTDDNKFLHPENVGMPFNSEANDYLMAIDEINNLGWFVTDRNQPKGKVCIYVFVPNSVRKIYDKHLYSEEELGRLAQLHAIAETWGDKEAAKEGKERLAALRKDIAEKAGSTSLGFVLNDQITINSYADIKSKEAAEMMKEWDDTNKKVKISQRTLQMFREGYRNGDKAQKEKLTPHILKEEEELEGLKIKLNDMAKAIRKTEFDERNK